MFSATEYYIYNPADVSRSYSILKSLVPLPNESRNYQSNWCKQIYCKSEYIRCHGNATEETVKTCFTKSLISPKDQTNAQIYLDKPFIELRSNIKKLKFLTLMKFLKRFLRKNLQTLMTPLLQQNLFYLMSQSLKWCVKSRSQLK